ncbi:bifunctional metallophosphatase/5'-nucleotidase [Virgibacillus profundi]|uniref:Bifunctional metallophosphatase/5'-nucleotidase n=1 Tax=Virgibacillus profundi TaxID=2024555 RepID=A0A2A2IFA8_9BACI|nr:bifunctional UDP-sugar hydrolase/5'-nucleotidase [Virgibacillus profundi]PAV30691.1 bifunctional metallophosphatase/5'-nucleotidase [Virgibacillus profundi]PXY54863.1 bifunctional metallophosphatase/5'-nucleotidase [Virgibacillus profundi]
MKLNTAKIKLLYTSDVHGNAMPILYGSNETADIGLTKYATIVKQIRKENEHVIVLDNGDLIQGTPLMTHYVKEHTEKENPMIGIMNRIGIDAGVIGNHEFNFGAEILSDAINQSNFPWLSANILNENTGKPKFGPPYIIKTLDNGIKVAIVGITTHYIPNWESTDHIKGIQFADAFSTIQKWVKHIRDAESPDVVIASYHGGFEKDIETGEPTEALTGENQGYDICEQIDGIDVLLTGHQHRKLIGTINDVLVIQPGNNGSNYGEIDIELHSDENDWEIYEKHAFIHTLDNVESDPEIMSYMEELEAFTQKWLDQPIGYIEGDMSISNPLQARISKHPFIEFIQKVQMDVSGVDISVSSLLNNSSEGFGSVVTMRDVVSNYMYPNTLVVLELSGKDIKDALEKSAEYFVLGKDGEIEVNPAYVAPKPQHYNYDMWEGINYSINLANPFGARVENITYHGKALKENEFYHVVLNNYRASGGGNYEMFKGKTVVKEIQKDAVELIRSYFEKHATVPATAVNNFVIKTK